MRQSTNPFKTWDLEDHPGGVIPALHPRCPFRSPGNELQALITCSCLTRTQSVLERSKETKKFRLDQSKIRGVGDLRDKEEEEKGKEALGQQGCLRIPFRQLPGSQKLVEFGQSLPSSQ